MLCFLGLTIGADVFCINDSARMMRESKARRSRSQAVASVICFLPGLSLHIIRVSGKRPYSDICPQGDSCPRIFFAAIKTTAPRMYQLGKNPPHRFKSTLQSVKLGNINGHGWKDRLKISKLAEFGTDLLKKIEFRKVAKF